MLFSCPDPVSKTTITTYPFDPGLPEVPYMDIADGKIYGTSYTQEYSLNNKTSWADCEGGMVSVTFASGQRVWVREKAATTTEWYLGVVNFTSGYPDIATSPRISLMLFNSTTGYWDPKYYWSAGETFRIYYKYYNIGSAEADASFTTQFYLSTDRTITSADILLTSSTGTRPLTAGLIPSTDNSYYGTSALTFPSIPAGTYYLGYILDANNTVTELNDANNTSLSTQVNEVTVVDASSNTTGAFKIVNSWGTDSTFENVSDGHYWLTYNSMKSLQLPVYYYYNNYSTIYKPTAIAVFQITHTQRDKCKIILGLGDPADPYLTKEFQARAGTDILSGALSFPSNAMAIDISEFAHAINSDDVFLSITTASGAAPGTVVSFEIRYYSSITGSQIGSAITGETGAFAGNGVTTVFDALTTGTIASDNYDDITPTLRSTGSRLTLVENTPSESELEADMAAIGVYESGKNYNELVNGHGTGLKPPTRTEWSQMKKLVGLQSSYAMGTRTNSSVDNSESQYFPPVGNQGDEGSCVAFATGYYIHTYFTARENNWNLTGTSYGGTYPGAPLSNTDKIMSPDFIYHQINSGIDDGSSYYIAFTLLTRMGCCTWGQMPYSDVDYTSWPSEAAFLEAAKYRGSDKYGLDNYLSYGYFIIKGDAEINLLKNLIADGYIIACSIDASSTAEGLYNYMDSNDVIDISSMPSGYLTNHAQTIVGFKDGTSWNPSNP